MIAKYLILRRLIGDGGGCYCFTVSFRGKFPICTNSFNPTNRFSYLWEIAQQCICFFRLFQRYMVDNGYDAVLS